MRPVTFCAATLAVALERLGVATMPQLVDALGSPSRGTVFRKLRELDILSSYSHSGQYYTLRASADFNAHGLWAHGTIRFSTHGTLRATVAALTASAPRGWRAGELDELVGVNARGALRYLVQDGQLTCVKIDGRSLYCATDPARQRQQIAARRTAGQTVTLAEPLAEPPARLAVAADRFVGLLDERQRRLFAGLLSLLCGHGGDKRAAAWLGSHPKTVSKGRRELARGPVALPHGHVRRPGGGRKPLVRESSS